MYPSSMNNNSYPFYYNQSTILPAENNHIPFQNHQELYNYLVPSNVPAILENPINTLFLETPINKENTLNNRHSFNTNNQLVSSKRVSGKRDRHTKICTAQGIRDRRVRLSISIAREFFNLQDMLGFDKASKTLGWLLDKSKAAIGELTSSAKKEDYVMSSLDNIVVAHSQETRDKHKDKDKDNYEDEDNCDEKKDFAAKSTSKRKGISKQHCCNDQNVVKETRKILRVKARDRARERTKNKKTVINNPNKQHHHQSESSSNHQNEQNLVFLPSISPATTVPSTSSSCRMMNKGVSVAKSVVIRSKSPRRLPSYNYNYDNIMSKNDQEGYYNDYYNDYLAKLQLEGANNSGIIQQQPEIHFNAKTWDNDFSNRNLH